MAIPQLHLVKLRPIASRVSLLLLASAVCLGMRAGHGSEQTTPRMPFASVMPRTVVWAWEEPEDLRSANSDSVGVAYLAETIFLGAGPSPNPPTIRIVRRHQPLAVPPNTAAMAVVRMIAPPDFEDTPELRRQTTEALAEVAQHAPVRALQIDFDATRSQRPFYSGVLQQLRPRMPAAMPLSITALLSWCTARPGNGDWLHNLPVDEAVPMFFRLGGATRPAQDKSIYTLREPLCLGSRGIATDESWPTLDPHARVYLFSPRPWNHLQLAALAGVPQGDRPVALQQSGDAARRQPSDTGLAPLRRAAVTGSPAAPGDTQP